MSPTKTYADDDFIWVPGLLHKHIDDTMYTTPLENAFDKFDDVAHSKMTVAKNEIKGLIVEKLVCIFSDFTLAKFETKIVEALVNMFEIGICAT